MQIILLGSTLKLTQHLFLYGFPNLVIIYGYAVVVFLIFCEFFNFTLTFLCNTSGPNSPICASDGDTGVVYSPFWTSSLFPVNANGLKIYLRSKVIKFIATKIFDNHLIYPLLPFVGHLTVIYN